MTASSELVKRFGTAEKVQLQRRVAVGDLSYQLGPESVRGICWKGHEVIRAITWPIRDSDWITMRPTIVDEHVDQATDSDHYQLHFQVGEGALDCRVSIKGHASGELRATIDMQASADFSTNRAGFTVLHPITGVAGSDLQVTHSDDSVERTQFPTLISPDQPVMDFIGLRHQLHEVDIDIRFGGEVFEMEDQRNWSDASYKTYCVPLVYPFTYSVAKGSTVQQSIVVNLSGGASSGNSSDSPAPLSLLDVNEDAPQIGLAIEEAWTGTSETQKLIDRCKVQFLLARFNLDDPDSCLNALKQWPGLTDIDLDLEIVIPDGIQPSALNTLSQQLNQSGIRPAHVMALPESYLGSHQPSGPWPDGPTPGDVVGTAREAFPDTSIGAGMLTNFTEFNRCRPNTEQCDYVNHGNTTIVHAADDQSVMETLEALPQIFNSANVLRNSKPYRLGLVAIAGRTNPYGSGPADNAQQIRQTLAQVDPRQRGLFAAAWAVGLLGATNGYGIEAVTLAAPVGPFGIVWQKQDYVQAGFDDEADAVLYPLYHIVRAASAMSRHHRIKVEGLPAGVSAYGVRDSNKIRLLLANTTTQPCTLAFTHRFNARILDTHAFTAAVRDALWLDNAEAVNSDTITLEPYATAFMNKQDT